MNYLHLVVRISEWRHQGLNVYLYAGDITSGLEYASETITTIAPAQRQGIIALRGRDIVKTLPEGEKRLPAARSFQELLVASAQNSEAKSP